MKSDEPSPYEAEQAAYVTPVIFFIAESTADTGPEMQTESFLLPRSACSMFSVVSVSDVFPKHTKTVLIVFSSMCALSYAGLLALYFAYRGSKFLVVYTFYAIVCILFSAAMFGYSFIKTKRKSYLLYLLGILCEVPGGIVQAKRDLYFTLIWKMDYNTVYHMILLTTIILFMAGYLQSRKEKSAENR